MRCCVVLCGVLFAFFVIVKAKIVFVLVCGLRVSECFVCDSLCDNMWFVCCVLCVFCVCVLVCVVCVCVICLRVIVRCCQVCWFAL